MSNPELTVGLRVVQVSTGKQGVIRHREELFNECITCFDDLTAGSIPMSDLRPDSDNTTTTTTAPTQTSSTGFAGATTTSNYETAGEDTADPWTENETEDLAELDNLLAANQETPADKGFGEGDLVSVYSASQQKWYHDGVVEGTNTDKDGLWYVVRYSKGERQKLIHEFDTGVIKLRNEGSEDTQAGAPSVPQTTAPEISNPQETVRATDFSAQTSIQSDVFNPDDYEAVSPSIFKVGDPVAIYSTSKDSWFPDGTIKRTEEDDDGTWLVVQYNGGASEKAVNVLDTEIIRGLNYKKDDALDEF